MRPDVAMTWPFGRPARLGVAWVLWSLAPSLATKPDLPFLRRVGTQRQRPDPHSVWRKAGDHSVRQQLSEPQLSVVKCFGPTDRREFWPRVSAWLACGGGCGGAEPVGLGAGFEDGGVEGDAVDYGGDEAGVGEDGSPFAERQVCPDRDRGAFVAL